MSAHLPSMNSIQCLLVAVLWACFYLKHVAGDYRMAAFCLFAAVANMLSIGLGWWG